MNFLNREQHTLFRRFNIKISLHRSRRLESEAYSRKMDEKHIWYTPVEKRIMCESLVLELLVLIQNIDEEIKSANREGKIWAESIDECRMLAIVVALSERGKEKKKQ